MSEPSSLEPALSRFDFEDMAARWRLEHLTQEETEAFAVQALLKGFDGPALRELAWHQERLDEAYRLFERALIEMGMEVPSVSDALARLAHPIAEAILLGHRPLWDGAWAIRRLYFDAWLAQDLPGGLTYESFDAVMDLAWDAESEALHEPELRSLIARVLEAAPTGGQEPGFSPSLGGTRADPGEPEPEQTPPDEGWRFEFHFNFDVNLRRFFTWNWSSNNRRR